MTLKSKDIERLSIMETVSFSYSMLLILEFGRNMYSFLPPSPLTHSS